MSYALAVAADAEADLRRLAPWLQEEVWDELELRLGFTPDRCRAVARIQREQLGEAGYPTPGTRVPGICSFSFSIDATGYEQ